MLNELQIPIPSIWDWYTYLHEWLMFMVNVGEYAIHGWYGLYTDQIGFKSFNPGSTIQKHPVGIWQKIAKRIDEFQVSPWSIRFLNIWCRLSTGVGFQPTTV